MDTQVDAQAGDVITVTERAERKARQLCEFQAKRAKAQAQVKRPESAPNTATELGRMDEARDTVSELRKLDPSLTVSGYLARSPARNFETSTIWAEALRRAELPA